jgi:hypothetical protein
MRAAEIGAVANFRARLWSGLRPIFEIDMYCALKSPRDARSAKPFFRGEAMRRQATFDFQRESRRAGYP